MNMSVDDGSEIIVKAMEKYAEDKAWQLYLEKYGNMTEENFIPFNEFYKPNHEPIETKTAQEILVEVKTLLDANEWG